MNKEIVRLIRQGYTILTPTMRMSRFLKNNFAAQQIASGKTAWESADILPWHAWLGRFWIDSSESIHDFPYCLNTSQQQSVWLQLVQDSDFAEHLLQPQSVAKRALQAWDLSHQWQLPLFPEDMYINHDVRAFQSWAHSYQSICQKQNWVDNAGIPRLLIENLRKGTYRALPKLALVGHDDFQTQQLSLLQAIADAGGEVITVPLENKNRQVRGAGFIDARDEIDAAANWAGKLAASNPDHIIGIVAPDLKKLRTQLQDQFDDVLLAGEILAACEPERKPYSISLGQSLNSYPLISTAFLILGLMKPAHSIADIASLLRSPYLKEGREEQGKRAMFDATIREYGEQSLSLKSLIFIAKNHIAEAQQCLTFLNCVEESQTIAEKLPRSQSAHDWAQTFTSILSVFAWPGDRSLNSTEYQTMTAWQDLLQQFVSLDIVSKTLSYGMALAQLRQLATGFSFQPETAEVPIQIMGHAGAAGMHFEHLWILGLHEEAWPEAIEPSPFIPLELQREYHLPAASADNRLAHSRHMTERLLQSSADVVASYPQNEKERPLRPSSLIKQYLQTPGDDLTERLPVYSHLVFDSRKFEYIPDNRAPGISTGQRVRGGTGLFKDQAACGFRAFARHRLNARALVLPDIGLNAMERGSLLHDLMQLFWQKIANQEMLLELSAEKEEALIDDSVNAAISSYKKRRPQVFSERFIALEKQRLKAVLQEWLGVEKKRGNFRVLACELRHNIEFADIEVHTRIDRVDELEDGRKVIVDYKTGVASVAAWFGERPDDPQLPLYAATSGGEIAALAFARIKPGESKFTGIANGEDILPAVKSYANTQYAGEFEDWRGLLDHWESVLLALGNDFRQGRAEVNPKNESTCRYCDLHALCRIHELTQKYSEPASGDERNGE